MCRKLGIPFITQTGNATRFLKVSLEWARGWNTCSDRSISYRFFKSSAVQRLVWCIKLASIWKQDYRTAGKNSTTKCSASYAKELKFKDHFNWSEVNVALPMAFEIDFQRCLYTCLTKWRSSSFSMRLMLRFAVKHLLKFNQSLNVEKCPLPFRKLWIHLLDKAKILEHESLPADPRVPNHSITY